MGFVCVKTYKAFLHKHTPTHCVGTHQSDCFQTFKVGLQLQAKTIHVAHNLLRLVTSISLMKKKLNQSKEKTEGEIETKKKNFHIKNKELTPTILASELML